jgi:hypothetical protein
MSEMKGQPDELEAGEPPALPGRAQHLSRLSTRESLELGNTESKQG